MRPAVARRGADPASERPGRRLAHQHLQPQQALAVLDLPASRAIDGPLLVAQELTRGGVDEHTSELGARPHRPRTGGAPADVAHPLIDLHPAGRAAGVDDLAHALAGRPERHRAHASPPVAHQLAHAVEHLPAQPGRRGLDHDVALPARRTALEADPRQVLHDTAPSVRRRVASAPVDARVEGPLAPRREQLQAHATRAGLPPALRPGDLADPRRRAVDPRQHVDDAASRDRGRGEAPRGSDRLHLVAPVGARAGEQHERKRDEGRAEHGARRPARQAQARSPPPPRLRDDAGAQPPLGGRQRELVGIGDRVGGLETSAQLLLVHVGSSRGRGA